MAALAPTPTLVRAALIGVTGRMGLELLRAARGFSQLIITAAIPSPASLALGRDAGELAGVGALNLPVTDDLARALPAADVALDFSSAAAARDIPLLVAANTSLGVTLLLELVRIAARALPPAFDINILDTHHRSKPDAPSGTALALGAAAREARQAARDAAHREGDVGLASVRAGDIVGEHTVLFAGPGEQLLLTHRATDRAIFARGALAAALWLQSRPPGRYTMRDLLGQKQ